MTREQLYAHFALRKELEQAKEVLAALRDAASPGAQVLTGMPHAPGVSDKTGNLAVEIADMETEIAAMQEALAAGEPEIEAFIRGIRNSRTRTIFRLRLLRGMSWKEIALVLGRWTSENSVSSAFYAWLRTNHDE